ncbi:MAG: hypothetical protein KatS3mg003_1479 [Candidatus Nitrosocaldaceae archaeon]|nr:MAG: hypothetical protein KatS3mg003_1479 [Candidatus Nitrosocaldaceae archaeon]
MDKELDLENIKGVGSVTIEKLKGIVIYNILDLIEDHKA